MGILLVVNLHGKINSSAPVRRALAEMKVERKFSATIVADDVNTLGMLRLCKDYVAWCPAEKSVLNELLQKRGMVSETRRLDAPALKALGYKNYDDLADKMLREGQRLSSVSGLRPFFKLSPPRGGFGASLRRQHTQKGMLGNNPDLTGTVRRMI
jgi:large subunit ribosomal protein L30